MGCEWLVVSSCSTSNSHPMYITVCSAQDRHDKGEPRVVRVTDHMTRVSSRHLASTWDTRWGGHKNIINRYNKCLYGDLGYLIAGPGSQVAIGLGQIS